MYSDAAAGTVPTNTTYWQVLADKGDTWRHRAYWVTGATGPTGPTGVTEQQDQLTNRSHWRNWTNWSHRPTGVVWQSAWATATAYVANDLVENNGSSYILFPLTHQRYR